MVIDATTGNVRPNKSWTLDRLVTDIDRWQKTQKSARKLEAEHTSSPEFSINVYEALPNAGEPSFDFLAKSGLLVATIQLAISIVPIILHGHWATLCITITATCLALGETVLPQWLAEVRTCSRNTKKNLILANGNGAKHAVMIMGNSQGLDLQDMAAAIPSATVPADFPLKAISTPTGLLSLAMKVGWFLLVIINVWQGQQDRYLLCVAGIGFVHNLFVARAPRDPSCYGIHLAHKETIAGDDKMEVLTVAENRYSNLGLSMVKVFYPHHTACHESFWAFASSQAKAS